MVQKLSSTHLAIARYVVENPGCTLDQVSEQFGYTVPWISTLLNSDAMRAHLSGLNELCDAAVALDIPGRMRGIANKALELTQAQLDMIERVPTVGDREYVHKVSVDILTRLGYGGNGGGLQATFINNNNNTQINLNTPVDSHLLANARARMLKGTTYEQSPAGGGVDADALHSAQPSANEIPALCGPDQSGDFNPAAPVLEADSVPGRESAGSAV